MFRLVLLAVGVAAAMDAEETARLGSAVRALATSASVLGELSSGKQHYDAAMVLIALSSQVRSKVLSLAGISGVAQCKIALLPPNRRHGVFTGCAKACGGVKYRHRHQQLQTVFSCKTKEHQPPQARPATARSVGSACFRPWLAHRRVVPSCSLNGSRHHSTASVCVSG